MQPRFCTACGTALSPGAAFCTGCGARVQAAAVLPSAPPAAAVPAPPPASPPAPQSVAVPPQSAPPPAHGADWTSPEMQPGETELGTWTVNHPAPSGKLINGKLTVTNHRLLFRATGAVQPAVTLAGTLRLLRTHMADFRRAHTLVLHKDEIAAVRVEKGLLTKNVHVTAANGATYVFGCGPWSVDEVARALEQRWSVG